MDVETLIFLGVGLVGAVAAGAHLYGWIPPRYKTQLAAIQSSTAAAIGAELRAVFAEQEAKMAAAMKEAQDAEAAIAKGAEMSIVRSVGVDKQLQGKVDRLLGEAVLGPAMPLLRQFAPGLADALEENPALIDVVIRNPLFIKYVRPRIEQFLGSAGAGGSESVPAPGWGT